MVLGLDIPSECIANLRRMEAGELIIHIWNLVRDAETPQNFMDKSVGERGTCAMTLNYWDQGFIHRSVILDVRRSLERIRKKT